MLSKSKENNTSQMQIVSVDQLVPEDHLLRKIDAAIDFSFIYDLVEDRYSQDNGRPSIDPVTLIKIPIIQYMYGIKSMRQTIKEIEVNVAYRWFLGLDFYDKVPHFSTFGKNYKRRFEGTDLFEQIFTKILLQCMKQGLVDTDTMYVDATHVKAAANRKKAKKILVAKRSAKYYEDQLRKEIDEDREIHGKKPLKDKDDDDNNDPSGGIPGTPMKEQKQSTTDPESGWFHKGFPILYKKLKLMGPKNIVLDAGYKNPATAKLLIDDGVMPVMPYTRPRRKESFFSTRDFVYDEFYDCYLCPNDQVLKYSTTNRDGYREYKSNRHICENCPHLQKCTASKNHQKVLIRHIWQNYLDICEDIRLTPEGKDLYSHRKETIERCFGTAKEHHAMRYTQQIGKEKMAMKVGLTFACMNMKKLARILWNRDHKNPNDPLLSLKKWFTSLFFGIRPEIFLQPT